MQTKHGGNFNWPAIDDVEAPSQAWEFSSNLACEQENLHINNWCQPIITKVLLKWSAVIKYDF